MCLVGGARRTVCATRGARRVPPPGLGDGAGERGDGRQRQTE
eukprot:COSAG01_NODE_18491_length_1072_cov_1.554985_2_plen_41_part_01